MAASPSCAHIQRVGSPVYADALPPSPGESRADRKITVQLLGHLSNARPECLRSRLQRYLLRCGCEFSVAGTAAGTKEINSLPYTNRTLTQISGCCRLLREVQMTPRLHPVRAGIHFREAVSGRLQLLSNGTQLLFCCAGTHRSLKPSEAEPNQKKHHNCDAQPCRPGAGCDCCFHATASFPCCPASLQAGQGEIPSVH